MATTSNYLGLTLMADGEQENNWGQVQNANLELLEQKGSKITAKTITGGSTALSAAEAVCAIINLSGTLVSDATVTVPDGTLSAWVVNNGTDGDYSVTFQTVSGTGGTIAQGSGAFCFSDGTDVTVIAVSVAQLTSMLDVNGFALGDGARELLTFTETGSAVNEVDIANAATGSGPTVSAKGDDTNVDLNLAAKGTGLVKIGGSRVLVSSTTAKTGAYTVLTSDAGKMVDADASGGAFTVTLPTVASAGAGFQIGVKKTDSSSNAVTVDGDGSETIEGETTLALGAQYDVVWLICDGTEWFISAKSISTSDPSIGQHTISIPAGAMTPNETNGAELESSETTTNANMVSGLLFDASTEESAQFSIVMPKSWDKGTLVAQFYWTHGSTTTNFGVTWGLQAVAIGDDDALDAAFGTAQEVSDTGGTTDDRYVSDETSGITVAGSPGDEEEVNFRVYRDVADGSDTMAIDAKLTSIKLHYTTNAATDD